VALDLFTEPSLSSHLGAGTILHVIHRMTEGMQFHDSRRVFGSLFTTLLCSSTVFTLVRTEQRSAQTSASTLEV
jgi:hypothetical protein